MISCSKCCNSYHRSCLERYSSHSLKTPLICPICDKSLTMNKVALIDEKLFQEARKRPFPVQFPQSHRPKSVAKSRASKKSKSSSAVFVNRLVGFLVSATRFRNDPFSDEILLSDEIVPVMPPKPIPTKKSSKKSMSNKTPD
jgi:hypothetical protein